MTTATPATVTPTYQYTKNEDADGVTFTVTSDGVQGGIILGLGFLMGIVLSTIFYNIFNSGWGIFLGFFVGLIIAAAFSGSGKQHSAKILKSNGDLIINGKQYDRNHIKQIATEVHGADYNTRTDIKMLYGDQNVNVFCNLNENTATALYRDFSETMDVAK